MRVPPRPADNVPRVIRPPKSVSAVAVGLALVAAGATGCGREKEDDVANGKAQFVQKCGRCHILSHANGTGVQGPNLDKAFGTARRNGLGEKTIRGVVEDQISHVRRNSSMPKDLVTGKDARDVAAYVAQVAGIPGDDTGALAAAGAPKVSSKPIAAKGGTLTIPADPTGALAFASKAATAPAGQVQIEMPNKSSVTHDIAIKGGAKGPEVSKGGVSKFSASLKPGKYEFYCSVPGHEAGGMKGELTVK